MDSLEKFINDNREDFDKSIPDLKVWAALDKQLSAAEALPAPNAKIRPLKRIMSIAASVLVLLFAGGLGGQYYANSKATAEINSLADIAPEHEEAEKYFNQQIREKTARLAAYKKADVVQPDLQQLDEVFKELAAELKDAPRGTEEQIINAMIKNYQAKIDILNRVIEKTETVEAVEKMSEDEISI